MSIRNFHHLQTAYQDHDGAGVYLNQKPSNNKSQNSKSMLQTKLSKLAPLHIVPKLDSWRLRKKPFGGLIASRLQRRAEATKILERDQKW